jgi:hypothetical protein
MYKYKARPARQLHSTTAQPHNIYVMSSTADSTTSTVVSTTPRKISPVLRNFQRPTSPILKSAFELLCVIAVSRSSLDHWEDTTSDEWKEHVKVMINRFQNTNVTVCLIPSSLYGQC